MDDMMKIMPDLIAEEAQDAMKYANLAIAHREDHPEIAGLFMQLSIQELHHMQMISEKLAGTVNALHDQYHAQE